MNSTNILLGEENPIYQCEIGSSADNKGFADLVSI